MLRRVHDWLIDVKPTRLYGVLFVCLELMLIGGFAIDDPFLRMLFMAPLMLIGITVAGALTTLAELSKVYKDFGESMHDICKRATTYMDEARAIIVKLGGFPPQFPDE